MIHLLTAAASLVSLILMSIVAAQAPCPTTAWEQASTLLMAACLGAVFWRSFHRALA